MRFPFRAEIPSRTRYSSCYVLEVRSCFFLDSFSLFFLHLSPTPNSIRHRASRNGTFGEEQGVSRCWKIVTKKIPSISFIRGGGGGVGSYVGRPYYQEGKRPLRWGRGRIIGAQVGGLTIKTPPASGSQCGIIQTLYLQDPP